MLKLQLPTVCVMNDSSIQTQLSLTVGARQVAIATPKFKMKVIAS